MANVTKNIRAAESYENECTVCDDKPVLVVVLHAYSFGGAEAEAFVCEDCLEDALNSLRYERSRDPND